MKTIQDVEDYNTGYIEGRLQKKSELMPMIVFSHNDEVTVMALADISRQMTRMTLKTIRMLKPQWMCFMTEAYMRKYKPDAGGVPPDYEHGNMEKSFEMGDPTVIDAVILQIYFGKQKRMVTWEKTKKGLVNKMSVDNFEGYLDADD